MNPVIKVTTHRSHQYPIFAGIDLYEFIIATLPGITQCDKGFIIIDENVFKYHKQRINSLSESLFKTFELIVIAEGEQSKSAKELLRIIDFLLDNGIKRVHPVLVIGGGVTGDLGGFAASIALRGVPFVQIPTTLLSMVDSSVGGKTGINHSTGKNLIGSFYQPEAVFVDTSFLETLPPREWASGLGEVIKYAAISDQGLFDEIRAVLKNGVSVQDPAWLPIITKCIQIKADIVQEDELESGVRSYLNFGHTFAHAIEKALHYSGILHGEAVFLGMLAATHLSNLTGSSLDIDRIRAFKKYLNVKWPQHCNDLDHLIDLMKNDKKNTDDALTFILLDDWEKPIKKNILNKDIIKKALLMTIDDTKE
jgi:3-dehydroquinate synthase